MHPGMGKWQRLQEMLELRGGLVVRGGAAEQVTRCGEAQLKSVVCLLADALADAASE